MVEMRIAEWRFGRETSVGGTQRLKPPMGKQMYSSTYKSFWELAKFSDLP